MITDIRLQNFRSYKDSAFELDSGVNIIVGPNASGKTNLLEAVLVLCRGSSYKASAQELVKFGQQWARVDAHTKTGGLRTVKIKGAQKAFVVDNNKYIRLPQNKTLPTVLFEPLHLLMLGGSPELRREYLDDLLQQTILGYGTIRQAYKRTLRQRNSLLKKGPKIAQNQLFAWDIRISELGSQIAAARFELVEMLANTAPALYKKLSKNTNKLALAYTSTIPIKNYGSAMLKRLEAGVGLDFTRGFTGYGPHRDDLSVSIDNQSSTSASRGEVRTIVLTLKILELQMLEKLRGQKPVLLLDDVFSELDGQRRRALTEYLKNYQTFITTTDADVIAKSFTSKSNVILTKG